LFAEAARGLFSMIAPNLEAVRPRVEKRFETSEESYDYLLFDWLNELLFAWETDGFLPGKVSVQCFTDGASMSLRGDVWGEPVDFDRHQIQQEVKAITYHGLIVKQENGGDWLAEFILDI
jgi:SHS2 domain-containing protein